MTCARFYIEQNLNAFRSFIFIAYRSSGKEVGELNEELVERSQSLYGTAATPYDNNSRVKFLKNRPAFMLH